MADLAAVQSVSKALCDCYNTGGRAELGDFYASDAKFMAHGLEKVVGRKGIVIFFSHKQNHIYEICIPTNQSGIYFKNITASPFDILCRSITALSRSSYFSVNRPTAFAIERKSNHR